MYALEAKFQFSSRQDRENQISRIQWVLAGWLHNGQILGGKNPIAERKNDCSAYVITPEKNSLSNKFLNKTTREYLRKLPEAGVGRPTVSVLGKVSESEKSCSCSEGSYYILYTYCLSSESPLRCGNCFGTVPLYRIPKTHYDGYFNILTWEWDYKACDTLELHSTVGEKFALKQKEDLDSPLTELGLNVCSTIERGTKKKVFYHLFKGLNKNYASDRKRRGPGCGGRWHLKDPVHGHFDFKYNKCKLLSNVSPGS